MLIGSKNGKKPEPLHWTDAADRAFEELREAFIKAPLLMHFNPERKIRVETDASGFGIAGIMSQPNNENYYRPIAFWLRKMIPAEQNYEIYDQELLAIVKVFE